MTQDLGNSRIFVIASEAKQSLEILDLFLKILDLFLKILEFYLGILEFPIMSSSGLTRGSLYGILEFLKIRHCEALKKPKQSLEILDLFLEF